MIIKGVIEEVVYRNEENGYTVVGLDCSNEYVMAVGRFPNVNKGEQVELSGVFAEHAKYGQQFQAKTVKVTPPNTKEGIVRYLSSGLVKGVGPITALAIVEKFGEDTLDVIEFNPSRLAEVRGISARKANEIAENFSEIKKMQNVVMFLQEHNISTNMAIKIYNTYGNKTENILQTNPYKLVEDVDGIGFFTADKIAIKLGIDPFSEFRFRAGVLHTLKENSDKNGNTYIVKDNLIDDVIKLLGIIENSFLELIDKVLSKLILDNFIKVFEEKGVEIVALTKFYNIEKNIAETINEINQLNGNSNFDIDDEVNLYETQNSITMHDGQREAVRVAVNSGVSVITGGPGTGKTTIVKCMLGIFKNMSKKVKLIAPTGRAAKRLSESTNSDASTIHRALEVDFTNANMFNFNSSNKLPYDVIIVDEVSMVDVQLMHFLIRALKRTAKLVLVGDRDQLPSVGAGNVLSDIIASGIVNVAELTHIYRQSEDSLIISNAHLINSGQMPQFNNKSKDFFFFESDNQQQVLQTVVNMQSSRIPAFLGVDKSRIQVLAPMKAGVCGIDNLNKELQQINNPETFSKKQIDADKTTYRTGDRVMQTSNNYEREWQKEHEKGQGVFNGDIGVILDVNSHDLELTVLFEDGRCAVYNRSDISELILSYAITIHKSQGSEFDVVIIPIVGGPPMLLTKNLLYTGVTRAKKMVVLVGTKQGIARMVKNKHTSIRLTLLDSLLKESNNKTDFN